MSEAKIDSNLEGKTCESCGEKFECGANAEKCWCFKIDLSAETLAKLQNDFNSCLCASCLKEVVICDYENNDS